MLKRSVRPVGRGLAGAVVATIASAGVVWLFWTAAASALEAIAESGPDAPADLLVLGAAGAGAGLAAWFGLAVLVSLLAVLPGAAGRVAGELADRLAPAAVRRSVALVLGATLTAGAVPAVAHAEVPFPVPTLTGSSLSRHPPAPDPRFAVTGRQPADDAPAQQPGPAGMDPTRTRPSAPDPGFAATTPSVQTPPAPRPVATGLGPLGRPTATSATTSATASAGTTSTVTVVRGDSLWQIAARHLGPGATNQQIAREWPRWHAANRAVIGSNPHLIHAGQVLVVPTPEGASS